MKKIKLYEEFIHGFKKIDAEEDQLDKEVLDREKEEKPEEIYKDVKVSKPRFIESPSGVLKVPGWNMY